MADPNRKREPADFAFGPFLGEGSYSTVVLATEKATGQRFAVKVLSKQHVLRHNKQKYVMAERDLLNRLQHPLVVQLVYTFQDAQRLYFALEYAPHGDLQQLLAAAGAPQQGLAPAAAQFYAAEILAAVAYIHSQDVLHRDLKPENVLVGPAFHIRLTDFGTAAPAAAPAAASESADAPPRRPSFVGTAEYCSPELLSERAASFESDLWAFACVLYQLIRGRPPFRGFTEYMTFQRILKLDYGFPPGFPERAADLIRQILVLDPERRLGSARRYDSVQAHPYFAGAGLPWDSLWTVDPPLDATLVASLKERARSTEALPPEPFAF